MEPVRQLQLGFEPCQFSPVVSSSCQSSLQSVPINSEFQFVDSHSIILVRSQLFGLVIESDFPHIIQTFRLIEFSQVYFVLVSLFVGPPTFTHSDLSRDLTPLSLCFYRFQLSARGGDGRPSRQSLHIDQQISVGPKSKSVSVGYLAIYVSRCVCSSGYVCTSYKMCMR